MNILESASSRVISDQICCALYLILRSGRMKFLTIVTIPSTCAAVLLVVSAQHRVYWIARIRGTKAEAYFWTTMVSVWKHYRDLYVTVRPFVIFYFKMKCELWGQAFFTSLKYTVCFLKALDDAGAGRTRLLTVRAEGPDWWNSVQRKVTKTTQQAENTEKRYRFVGSVPLWMKSGFKTYWKRNVKEKYVILWCKSKFSPLISEACSSFSGNI